MVAQKKLSAKLKVLQDILHEMQSVLVAYSGGADSTFLLKVAKDQLKDKVIAVTARSETYPAREVKAARKTARALGVRHIVIKTNELNNRKFTANPVNRCYYCKKELFSQLKKLAKKFETRHVLCGSNFDDLADYRPGHQAAQELGVRSPLQEARLTKEEIRLLSWKLRLPSWDKPSFPCLSTRFPYKDKITKSELSRVARAEEFLRRFGFSQLRVRVHGKLARVEVPRKEMHLLFNNGTVEKVTQGLKKIGYLYTALDLDGYRMGSMNAPLSLKTRKTAWMRKK